MAVGSETWNSGLTARSSGAIERSSDRGRLTHPLLRDAVAHKHVHLVGIRAKENVRRSAPPGEALEARSVDRY
jgi:hypothetical protein